MHKFRVHIQLKKGIKGNESEAVQKSLSQLGFTAGIKLGKFVDIEFPTPYDAEEADKQVDDVHKMCKKLLVNPVMEEYEFKLIGWDV